MIKSKKNTNKLLKLDLGSGSRPYKDYLGVDNAINNNFVVKKDVLIFLKSLPKNSVSHIYSRHFLEHSDSDKFLKAIIDNNEQFLTPTSFIQSTHNTVGAQIALGLQCKGYNFTYVNGAVSFESALLDAKLQLEYEEVNSILVGGIDETSQHTIDLYKMVYFIKRDEDKPFSILNSKSNGAVLSEGASFFVIETEPKQSSYAVVKDISIYNELTPNEVSVFIIKFLAKNNLNTEDIDVLVLGKNGDFIFDNYYEKAESAFNKASKVYYKHLSGEYSTVSAFGLWVAAKILKTQKIPEAIKMNTINKEKYDYVLLYNQYRGKDHSLILLKKC